MLNVKRIHHQPMDMNSYLLIHKNQVIVIDPGMNGQSIKEYLDLKNKSVEAVLLTHGHYDHIRGIESLNEFLPFNVYIHEKDVRMLYSSKLNYATAFNQEFELSKYIRIVKVKHHSKINILDEDIQVIHTPGHTDGSVMYQYQQKVFSGDTLFYDSIGRTDLFSGSFNAIRRSIKMIKNELSNNMMIYPGHGQSGKLKEIKKVNRFLNER